MFSQECRIEVLSSAVSLVMLAWSATTAAEDPVKVDKSAKVDIAEVRMMAGAASPLSQLPAVPANGEMSFVFSDFTPAVYPGWDACPGGWSRTNREAYLATVSAAERDRLQRPENEPELTRLWKASTVGANHSNICTNYDQYPNRPLQAMVQSKTAFGLHLADSNSTTCHHDTFTSPLGEKNIDNQAYRALGCARSMRGPDGNIGETGPGYKNMLSSGQFTVVLILRGVKNLRDDPDVEVILASSHDQPIVTLKQDFVTKASYNVASEPQWRNVLHGHIIDGVLTTDAKDVLLLRANNSRGGRPARGPWNWDFAGAKLRLAFRADGSLEGLLGAYETPLDLQRYEIGGGTGSAQIGNIDCASRFNTLVKLADGVRDPKTGICTRDSYAYRVTAVPAFVFDHQPEQEKTAQVSVP